MSIPEEKNRNINNGKQFKLSEMICAGCGKEIGNANAVSIFDQDIQQNWICHNNIKCKINVLSGKRKV